MGDIKTCLKFIYNLQILKHFLILLRKLGHKRGTSIGEKRGKGQFGRGGIRLFSGECFSQIHIPMLL